MLALDGQISQIPIANVVIRLTREDDWAQNHPDIMGPRNSFFYFGPSRSTGHLIYGNTPEQAMADSMIQKKDTSTYVHPSFNLLGG